MAARTPATATKPASATQGTKPYDGPSMKVLLSRANKLLFCASAASSVQGYRYEPGPPFFRRNFFLTLHTDQTELKVVERSVVLHWDTQLMAF